MKNAATIGRSIAFIALAVGVAAPAFAEEAAKMIQDPKSGKYCLKSVNTGSRMGKMICQSRAEWAAEGLNIPERPKAAMAKR